MASVQGTMFRMKIEALLCTKNATARAACRRAPALMAVTSLLAAAAALPTADIGLADFRHGRVAEALHTWQDEAAAGDARSALYIGVLYDSGLGVPQDSAMAMRWYRQAAEAGSPAGAFNVGVLYDAGQGRDAGSCPGRRLVCPRCRARLRTRAVQPGIDV